MNRLLTGRPLPTLTKGFLRAQMLGTAKVAHSCKMKQWCLPYTKFAGAATAAVLPFRGLPTARVDCIVERGMNEAR